MRQYTRNLQSKSQQKRSKYNIQYTKTQHKCKKQNTKYYKLYKLLTQQTTNIQQYTQIQNAQNNTNTEIHIQYIKHIMSHNKYTYIYTK